MESRANRVKTYLASTASTIKNLILPTATAVTTYLSHDAIQAVRELDASPLKDSLKTRYATVASTVNLSNIAASSFGFFETLIQSGAWSQFSASQRLALCTTMIIAFSSAGYSVGVFGAEENTLASGLSATTSILAFNVANNLTSFFALKNETANQENEEPTERSQLVNSMP